MSSADHRVRRALIDDLPALREMWAAMHFEPGELANQLAEFQVAESADGTLAGAIGLRISGQHACLHSEAYSDFSVADKVRELFWERIQVIAANHGVFRLWTRENSPFWNRWGFRPASGEILERLPAPWKDAGEGWFTLQLKDEDVINAVLEKETAAFKDHAGREIADIKEKTKTFKIVFTVVGLAVGLGLMTIGLYLFIQRLSQGFGR